MRILVIGGTGFLGGAATRAGLTGGHDVTVMTRSGRNVAPGAAVLIADRMGDLPDLTGQFDAVIDTCGYAPDMIDRLKLVLGDVHYIFVSSISVYDDLSLPEMDETAAASSATDEDLQFAADLPMEKRGNSMAYGAAYGRLKRAAEEAVVTNFGDEAALIRLGLIVGPGDYMDRFPYWVRRCDEDRPLIVPGPENRLVQIIDIADAGAFMVRLAEAEQGGVFNLTGRPMRFLDMLDAICAETKVDVPITTAPLSVFTDVGAEPWGHLPLVLPDKPEVAHMLNVSIAKAESAGLTFRPLAETVQDVLAWDRGRRGIALKCGMPVEMEAAVRKAV
ncbi:NAD-dependent epimerase/dehydratase family protein [Yoonia sp. 2307UL14-13]|uniref:NAD-dependent epimerase/dehydratase family protein n=1 Tax=Yoonia sp. 2307UL14-13 TaxID=3126506 RepID=UPI0030B1B49B